MTWVRADGAHGRRRSRDRRSLPAFPILLAAFPGCCFTSAHAEPFIGQFELKTLESAPGSFEFQSQNAWSWDRPARRIAVDDPNEFEVDENSIFRERYALELEMGLARWLKMRVGLEFERERIDEPDTIELANDFGSLELGEVGAELVAIVMPRDGDGVGLGFVTEIEGPPDQEESNNLTLGAIVEFQSARWFAAATPMVVYAFGGDAEEGEGIDNKWDFAYAAQLKYEFSPAWSLAVEGYGTIERLSDSGRPSEAARRFGDHNQHRVGPVLYYAHEFGRPQRREPSSETASSFESGETEGTSLTIGLGLLEGLNEHTPDHTIKLSVELDF